MVTVVGAIHGQHRRSEAYSLDLLRRAIVKFEPDILLVELPPDRFATASTNFDEYGEVSESRADDFPELTDVVFPLRKQLGFKMIPVAAWRRQKPMAGRSRAARTTRNSSTPKLMMRPSAAVRKPMSGCSATIWVRVVGVRSTRRILPISMPLWMR